MRRLSPVSLILVILALKISSAHGQDISPNHHWKVSVSKKWVQEGMAWSILVSATGDEKETQTVFSDVDRNSYWSPGPEDIAEVKWSADSCSFTFPLQSRKYTSFVAYTLVRGGWIQILLPKSDLKMALNAWHISEETWDSVSHEQSKEALSWSPYGVLKWKYDLNGAETLFCYKIKLVSGIPRFECLSVSQVPRKR